MLKFNEFLYHIKRSMFIFIKIDFRNFDVCVEIFFFIIIILNRFNLHF